MLHASPRSAPFRAEDRLTRAAWRAAAGVVLAAVSLAAFACRRERASVEELYTTRMLGVSYLQRNQLQEAESEFLKLTKLAPDDPLGFANLGLVYLQGGRYAEAEKQLDRARDLDPSNVDVGLALARLYSLTNRPSDARELLETLRGGSPRNAHVLYSLAELDSAQNDPTVARRYRDALRAVLAVAPANIAVRLDLVDAFARGGESDSAVKYLEEIRRIPPEPPPVARASLDSTIQLLRAGNAAGTRSTLDRLLGLLEVTSPYQASLDEVRSPQAPLPGRPILTFVPKSFVTLHGVRTSATVDSTQFIDATADAGVLVPTGATGTAASAPGAIAVGDVDGDGTDDLFVSMTSGAGAPEVHLYRVRAGGVRDATANAGITLPRGALFATFADADNDGWLDLFVIDGDGRGHLFRNGGTGTFTDVTAKAGLGELRGARSAVFVDVDHDGDLDLILLGGAQRAVYRNNLDGTFTESAAALGLAGPAAASAVFADFDDDGRIDLFLASPSGGTLLHNGGAQRFADATAASGLASAAGTTAAVADYDGDGRLDLFVGGAPNGEASLWHNEGGGRFARDVRASAALRAARGAPAALFVDYDNDGWIDLLTGAAGTGGGLHLFRNDSARFVDRTSALPDSARAHGASVLAALDMDDDGDEDVALVDGAGAPRILRNDGGNSNLAVNV
ncbi:MAG TPA: FG-GAP-like repeat-containing protein, partial [Gemmatimonadaceae bacterium]|nr:FG-GAP-like repeat-containing protein [Gemmatimonadaceae bacterium]